ncbi:MAG TPA: trypsin-like peptidase domain-containing protein [Candidatus Paceibacterota bacterium]|jgi:serine protease Do|nr:trypsin-like peptidase domain-containing protein [Candidatus Pacearchaeota archaeon]HPC30666.1 trypsin-like peptidase domain-containing protein [Candidatus Pacearchaeota archaeon]HQG09461.1 trypsin-like peptidase domain-containing protein [Candidatus Pacearchaeota archaeon]HRR94993.1 trypsin-like peptidase domain-containing protein [Candidatus Paceibacterota bacterium]HRU21057.1 trypsin-like peptidase domain-containing protein [Candidatus Paceibacterota bacterium]
MLKEKSPIVKIAKKVCPAVITIIASRDLPKIEEFYFMPVRGEKIALPKKMKGLEKTKIGGGSGFIVSEDGYILTCNHVVEDSEADYTVIVDPDHKYGAQVLARDPLIDMAILKIEGHHFSFLKLGNSDAVELGESVVAVGNPLGEFEDTLSAGIISGLSRRVKASNGYDSKITNLRGLIQTDAAINPGNSGGPLVNLDGQVIGINTAMIMGAENIGFALPINSIKEDLKEVKKHGKIKRPYLGVKYILLNEVISKANKLPVNYGALVVREMFGEPAVAKGSSADLAGIKEYDIILEINGEKIGEEHTLSDALSQCLVGQEISLLVWRNNQEINLKAVLKQKQ